jgi:hypothetical protein
MNIGLMKTMEKENSHANLGIADERGALVRKGKIFWGGGQNSQKGNGKKWQW